ncbi:hypothetical protein [Sphingomonas tagetis]|jgi:hypothetical protein|nr:hypothetical protein [Sphingomonas tagetis]
MTGPATGRRLIGQQLRIAVASFGLTALLITATAMQGSGLIA